MIKREQYLKEIRKFMDKPIIKVITGMRRSGKSMILKLISFNIYSPANCLYTLLNCTKLIKFPSFSLYFIKLFFYILYFNFIR